MYVSYVCVCLRLRMADVWKGIFHLRNTKWVRNVCMLILVMVDFIELLSIVLQQ